jgi:hypothetical protein
MLKRSAPPVDQPWLSIRDVAARDDHRGGWLPTFAKLDAFIADSSYGEHQKC